MTTESGDLSALIKKAERDHRLTREELAALLAAPEREEELAAAADRVRREYVGDGIHLRALIEFSNICRRNCLYCGLRSGNSSITRYRLTPDEILKLAEKSKSYGYKTVTLQSGEDMRFTAERLAAILRAIKDMGFAITLSIGERTREEYAALRKAGADRFLMRIETTDRAIYEKMDPGMSADERRRCIRDLKELGYETGTGSLVGLPGTSAKTLADDILFFQEIDADMIGIGPFIPNPDTPLKDLPHGDMGITRRMVSLTRLLLPEANIPATTAMETLAPGSRERILASGANVVMPNATEGDARKNYALYPGKANVADAPEERRNSLEEKIKKIGRYIADDPGWRKRNGKSPQK